MKSCEELRETMLATLPLLFVCQEENNRLKISTPYLYPNGDYIDLYLVETPNGLYLTDLGETMGYLADYGIALKQSSKRRKIIHDILLTHNVELFQGELRVYLEKEEQVAHAVVRLSQAITQISDLVFTLRLGTRTTFKEEVEEFWVEYGIPFERDYVVIGGSGESYTVDFYLSVPKHPWLVETLSSQSRSYANTLVSRVIRVWHDLHRVDGRYRYLSLIDDSADVWKAEWLDQLAEFSEVIAWSEREKLLQLLKAASGQGKASL